MTEARATWAARGSDWRRSLGGVRAVWLAQHAARVILLLGERAIRIRVQREDVEALYPGRKAPDRPRGP
jgi:hypothetical protein